MALAVVAAIALPATARAQDVVDIPVSFAVTNTNASGVPCASDLAPHTIRGHLTAPAALLDEAAPPVTVYLHSLSTGEWQWRFRAQPGVDYAMQMAHRGLASLTIDRLGYGASDSPHGMAVCAGASADILHQIVAQLRGSYGFGKVFVAGHSMGGLIAEIAAYSFKDIDGLMLLAYADGGTNFQASDFTGNAGTAIPRDCLTSGYAQFGADVRARQAYYGVPGAITDAAMRLRSLDPCGELASSVPATAVNLARLKEITVPVLMVYGRNDPTIRAGAPEQQPGRFTGTRDVTTVFLPDTGHFFMLGATAPRFRDVVAGWLGARS
jgi:pimeloyl-ACP methyl ester carboxylesterase